eukprot:scaffold52437_cov55-Phaeocystis_antarctica.AAC.2
MRATKLAVKVYRHPSSNRFTRMQLAQQQLQLLPRLPAATERGEVGEQPSLPRVTLQTKLLFATR